MPRMKGKKYIFNRQDTFNLGTTMDTFIYEGLKKFKEIITTDKVVKEWAGVPSIVMYDLFPDGGDVDKYSHSEDQLMKGKQHWHSILDKMIYAFENKEPCISDYNFEFVAGEDHHKKTGEGYFQWDMKADNQDEYDRYREDEASHEERVREGRKLFAEYYENLWW